MIAFTWFVLRGDPFALFLAAATIGTLILLVVYILATIGMVKLVFFSGDRRGAGAAGRAGAGGSAGDGRTRDVATWEIVIPILGIIVLGYTLFRNVWPLPTGAAWWGPSVALAWIAVGILLAVARPAAARRAGQMLMRSEGLSGKPPEVVSESIDS